MLELTAWMAQRQGIVSLDADFFLQSEEQQLAPLLTSWVRTKARAGIPAICAVEHLDLLAHVTKPVDYILNFDYHMDCSIEFLHGRRAKRVPCCASFFEALLSESRIAKYIWVVPSSRYHQAALVYASALMWNRQPLLRKIHCIDAKQAPVLIGAGAVELVFACRSPEYSTVQTDSIFQQLQLCSTSDLEH